MIFFRRASGAERVMISFFAGPAWAGASHDFFSQGQPGLGESWIFCAGPARAGASHDLSFAGPAWAGASHFFISHAK